MAVGIFVYLYALLILYLEWISKCNTALIRLKILQSYMQAKPKKNKCIHSSKQKSLKWSSAMTFHVPILDSPCSFTTILLPTYTDWCQTQKIPRHCRWIPNSSAINHYCYNFLQTHCCLVFYLCLPWKPKLYIWSIFPSKIKRWFNRGSWT